MASGPPPGRPKASSEGTAALPMTRVLHAGPALLLGQRVALLQQLDRDVVRRPHKGDLGHIELARDLQHPSIRLSLGIGKHDQLISTETRLGEYIADKVPVFHRR